MTYVQTQRAYAQSVSNASTNGPHFDTRDPNANDLNWSVGQIWINTLGQTLYYLNNFVSSAGNVTANWIPLSGSASLLEFLQGNTGGPVAPDSSFKIQILGSGAISVAGNPATNTLTISDTSNLIGTVTTLGLQTATVLSIPVTANNVITVDAIISGYATSIAPGVSAGIGGFLSATFISGSLLVSSIGTPDVIQHSFVSASANFTASTSGLNILIKVVGDVAYNIDWKCSATIVSVG